MTNRIALIEPPSSFNVMRDMYSSTISKLGYCWPNVDLLSLSGQLRDDFVCKIFDFSSSQMKSNQCYRLLKEFEPDHLIFAYGESTGRSDLLFSKSVKDFILPKQGKVLGTGGSLIHNPKRFMAENDWIDGIVMNYAYSSINEYLKGSIESINLFAKTAQGNFTNSKRVDPESNFDIGPGLHEHLNFDSYYLPQFGNRKFTSISTSWGCPYKCSFCVSSKLNYRMRSANSIFREIEYCKTLGVNTFFFRDNVFGINKAQIKELGNLISSSGKTINFMSDTRLDLINDSVISFFNQMGRAALNFGIESKSEETLVRFMKGLKTNKAYETLKKCWENNIVTTGYFILGLEGEVEEDVQNTIDYAQRIPLNYASFNLPIPIEGTKLRDDAISRKLIDENSYNYDGSGLSIIPNQNIDDRRLKELQIIAYKKFYFRASIICRILLMNIGIKPLRKLFKGLILLKNWNRH